MDERTRQRLQDIVDVADELAGELAGMTLASFRHAKGKQRIAERLLELAGEAANHVPNEVRDAIAVNWEGLRGMRVLLAHAYHRVEPGELWAAATKSLPPFAVRIRAFLGDS